MAKSVRGYGVTGVACHFRARACFLWATASEPGLSDTRMLFQAHTLYKQLTLRALRCSSGRLQWPGTIWKSERVRNHRMDPSQTREPRKLKACRHIFVASGMDGGRGRTRLIGSDRTARPAWAPQFVLALGSSSRSRLPPCGSCGAAIGASRLGASSQGASRLGASSQR